ncbi:MAG TPA: hypothetical protein VF175_08725, partial [Lacipirellula sp.]
EEIHYTPTAERAEEPAASEVAATDRVAEAPEEPPPAADPEPIPAELPAAEPTAAEGSTTTPSTSDLFPSDGGEAPTGSEEAEDEAADAVAEANADSILPTPPVPEDSGDDAPSGETPSSMVAEPPTPAEQQRAWEAVSKWSLAAAIHAKGLPNAPQAPILAEAAKAATGLGITLPELPTASRDDNLEAAVIEGLRGELAVAVRNAFANRFGEAQAAAADLALRSHLLLLTYSPRNADAALEAEALRRAGEASGLPAELWTPLVELVAERAPFLEVRQAVFDLHRRVDAHLSEAAERA